MNPFTVVWRKLTYRTGPAWARSPHRCSFKVTGYGWGGREVHDPHVGAYLQARRERLVREGLDPVDLALLDPATIALLANTKSNRISFSPARLDFHQTVEFRHGESARAHLLVRPRAAEVRR